MATSEYELAKERAMRDALEAYWKDKQLGPTATMVRLAFEAGFSAGMVFEDEQKWQRLMFEISKI